MAEIRATWIAAIAALITGIAAAGDPAAAQTRSRASGTSGQLLLLVTETVDRPGEKGENVEYWWRTPSEPAWTSTDRVLRSELEGTPGADIRPSDGVRISRIYQRPDLSLDNASSLASIVGAQKMIVGTVEYDLSRADSVPGLHAVHVDATLQLVDVESSEPKILQQFRIRRSLFGAGRFERLVDRARNTLGERAGALVRRVLAAASGPVGLEESEPVLAFHDLERGAALARIRRFIGGLEDVDRLEIRWASEGLVALAINPSSEDTLESVRTVAEAVEKEGFDRMKLVRRRESGANKWIEFDVELADDFGTKQRNSESKRDGE